MKKVKVNRLYGRAFVVIASIVALALAIAIIVTAGCASVPVTPTVGQAATDVGAQGEAVKTSSAHIRVAAREAEPVAPGPAGRILAQTGVLDSTAARLTAIAGELTATQTQLTAATENAQAEIQKRDEEIIDLKSEAGKRGTWLLWIGTFASVILLAGSVAVYIQLPAMLPLARMIGTFSAITTILCYTLLRYGQWVPWIGLGIIAVGVAVAVVMGLRKMRAAAKSVTDGVDAVKQVITAGIPNNSAPPTLTPAYVLQILTSWLASKQSEAGTEAAVAAIRGKS